LSGAAGELLAENCEAGERHGVAVIRLLSVIKVFETASSAN
jgi:hypothetical protein